MSDFVRSAGKVVSVLLNVALGVLGGILGHIFFILFTGLVLLLACTCVRSAEKVVSLCECVFQVVF